MVKPAPESIEPAASDELVTQPRAHRDPLAGRLRLALLPSSAPYLLVSAAIRRAWPRLELHLYEYQTAPMLQNLDTGESELGLLALPVAPAGLEAREPGRPRPRAM